MFSQYEISTIKSIWLSLQLSTNFNHENIPFKNYLPMFQYNQFTLQRFELELITNIIANDVSTKNTPNHKYDILEKYSLLLTNTNYQLIKTSYQINSFINLITVLIYHLDLNKTIPQNYITELSKVNSRLYSITPRDYSILGNSLIKTIDYFLKDDLFMGQKKVIFSKFLSKILTALVYYSVESPIVFNQYIPDEQSNITPTTKTTPHKAQSILTNGSNSPRLSTTESESESESNSPTPQKSTTMSIISQPSEYTEQSSLMSYDNYSYSRDINSEISSIKELTNKPDFNNNSVIPEEEHDEIDIEEDATITASMTTNDASSFIDDSYDYLNSFGLSSVENEEVVQNHDNNMDQVYDLRRTETNMSTMSSFKKWNSKFKKNSKPKTLFKSKNLTSGDNGSLYRYNSRTSNYSATVSSNKVVNDDNDDGCVIM
ncbi:hypothetical protein SBY92_001715 [Candida maltosa Xu316]